MPIIKPTKHSLVEQAHLAGRSKESGYLVYENDGYVPIIGKYLQTGYKHVYFVKKQGLFWIKLDSTLDMLNVTVLPFDYRDTIIDVLEGQDVTWQRVESWRHTKRYRVKSVLAPFSCTEVMKAILGINRFFLFTPYQLFSFVEKRNGRIGWHKRA